MVLDSQIGWFKDGSEPLRMDNTLIYLLVLKSLPGLIP
jgi:hypothetical protein